MLGCIHISLDIAFWIPSFHQTQITEDAFYIVYIMCNNITLLFQNNNHSPLDFVLQNRKPNRWRITKALQ